VLASRNHDDQFGVRFPLSDISVGAGPAIENGTPSSTAGRSVQQIKRRGNAGSSSLDTGADQTATSRPESLRSSFSLKRFSVDLDRRDATASCRYRFLADNLRPANHGSNPIAVQASMRGSSTEEFISFFAPPFVPMRENTTTTACSSFVPSSPGRRHDRHVLLGRSCPIGNIERGFVGRFASTDALSGFHSNARCYLSGRSVDEYQASRRGNRPALPDAPTFALVPFRHLFIHTQGTSTR